MFAAGRSPYEYCHSNPITKVDPDGRLPQDHDGHINPHLALKGPPSTTGWTDQAGGIPGYERAFDARLGPVQTPSRVLNLVANAGVTALNMAGDVGDMGLRFLAGPTEFAKAIGVQQETLEALAATPGLGAEIRLSQSLTEFAQVAARTKGLARSLVAPLTAGVTRTSVASEVVAAGRAVSADIRMETTLPKPMVEDSKLRNFVDNLYKGTTNPNRFGTGTTADAVRAEQLTGRPTAGKFHTQKAEETMRGLQKWLTKATESSYRDKLVARSLLEELKDALRRNR